MGTFLAGLGQFAASRVIIHSNRTCFAGRLNPSVRGYQVSSTPQAERLIALLREHGVDGQLASGLAAWSAYKAYGREVFGPQSVGLLFQVGTYDFTGRPLFYFDPVCQFEIFDADGEHDHFEQLHCELTCLPDAPLRGIEASLWSFDYPTADAFFADVEALPDFQASIQRSDYALSVSHEAV